MADPRANVPEGPRQGSLPHVEAGEGGHVAVNRGRWNSWAPRYAEVGRRNWAAAEPHWGIWAIPEARIGALGDVEGLDVVELGCGTAYWSAWLARRGARPTGVDLSTAQLETARELQREHGLDFPLIEGDAEALPLPDASFDLALSEYGACLWCEPQRWISEAARVLRPGGRLVFLTNSPLVILCSADDEPMAGDRLVRDQFGLHRVEFEGDDEGIEFHVAHGELIALLRANGFEVEALHELQAPADGDSGQWDFVTLEWARRWPCEELWVARRRHTAQR